MSRYTESTPCPVMSYADDLDLHRSQYCERTEEVNFTRDFQYALGNPAARRSFKPAESTGAENSASFAVKNGRRTSVQEECKIVQNGHDQSPKFAVSELPSAMLDIAPARRLTSTSTLQKVGGSKYAARILHSQPKSEMSRDDIQIRKKPRRRTIYVPSDDTTICTIHPAHLPCARDSDSLSLHVSENFNASRHQHQSVVMPATVGQRRPLAAAPKRGPLQPVLKTFQETEYQRDMPGTGPGKENVSPALASQNGMKSERDKLTAKRQSTFELVPGRTTSTLNGTYDSSTPSVKESPRLKWNNESATVNLPEALPNVAKILTQPEEAQSSYLYNGHGVYHKVQRLGDSDHSSDGKHVKPLRRLLVQANEPGVTLRRASYQILSEDITRPEMFEDAWLDHQDFAIQQLVNSILETGKRGLSTPARTLEENRRGLLTLYQKSEHLLLYQKLRASLNYGALSPPRGSIATTSKRMRSDVGFRQKFLSIWTASYDLQTLLAAAEIVMGREIVLDARMTKHGGKRVLFSKREVQDFLDSCLLRNDDVSDSGKLSPISGWRRTVLRSLMMVLLMDRAKETKMISKNLFQTSSRLKSSRSVINEIAMLLLPSFGDINRPLSLLGFHVGHHQVSLSEYRYDINNVATDQCDGVILTRLVELLRYSPEGVTDVRNTVSTAIPTGERLTDTQEEDQSKSLSQHLKFPCAARSHRISNVQLALRSLQDMQDMEQIIKGVTAEDIVDGHRERTITLLWYLVSKRGLHTLIDFKALKSEVARLRRFNGTGSDTTYDDDDGGQGLEGREKQEYWLQAWAEAIAQKHGCQISNLTTSFADGRVFGKIVDEYHKYLSDSHIESCPGTEEQSARLKNKLRRVGCSASFASIFGHERKSRVFDRYFTIAALAFLCSRLLEASKRGRAVEVIQRAYRQRKMRQIMRRQLAAMSLSQSDRGEEVEAARGVRRARRTESETGPLHAQRYKERTIENMDIWLP